MEAGTASGAVNWWIEIVKGAITLAVGFVGAVLLQNYRTGTARRLLSATYLENIATSLEAIADAFEKHGSAYMEIHRLRHLVRGLQTNMPKLVDDETLRRLDELSKDYYRTYDCEEDPPLPKHSWIEKARKTAGRLRAKIDLIKAQ